MFSVECHRHGARVLLSAESIVALVPGPDGIEVHWRCTCGESGVGLAGPAAAGAAEKRSGQVIVGVATGTPGP
jgi:hypothetical protein